MNTSSTLRKRPLPAYQVRSWVLGSRASSSSQPRKTRSVWVVLPSPLVLDTYWSYLTQGAIDITSVIRPHASDLRARAQRLGGDPLDTEVVTLRGSKVTLVGSGDEEGHDAPRPEPPRAGRSRPPRPEPYIPAGTSLPSPKELHQHCYCKETPWGRGNDPVRDVKGPYAQCCGCEDWFLTWPPYPHREIPVGTCSSSLYEVRPQHQWWCGGAEPCACTEAWKALGRTEKVCTDPVCAVCHPIPVGTPSVSLSEVRLTPHQCWCTGVEAGARVAIMAWSPVVPSAPAPGRLGSGARAVPLSPEAGAATPVCPCCGGTAGLLRAGDAVCTLCQRAPLHGCGRCWDHCRCTPNPMAASLDWGDG